MLRKDCLNDTATLNNFHALEDDSIELFHWLMSVSSPPYAYCSLAGNN